ncbi:MAG TPA: HNH endonuclease signature motif containing protein [Pyrinomonadaceae bacterium]|jgi:hypothetical protein
MSDHRQQSWLLLTFGDQRQYAGNTGYDDDPQKVYHYDSFVPNHKRVSKGDIAFIRGTKKLLGIAMIEQIHSYQGYKLRRRCPECNTVKIQVRRKAKPTFRCENKHTFEVPSEQQVECVHYKALFGDSFIATPDAVTVAELHKACPQYNDQLAMQLLNVQWVAGALISRAPSAQPLLEAALGKRAYLAAEEANLSPEIHVTGEGNTYVPANVDHRDSIERIIRVRRGQQTFRHGLISRHGPACMVTGCELLDVIEAAHISPYRGINDQHIENGLLLRADIHVLFDLDLMGIEPETLTVRFHPVALKSGYMKWEGRRLSCKVRPSTEALETRWLLFNKRKEME